MFHEIVLITVASPLPTISIAPPLLAVFLRNVQLITVEVPLEADIPPPAYDAELLMNEQLVIDKLLFFIMQIPRKRICQDSRAITRRISISP